KASSQAIDPTIIRPGGTTMRARSWRACAATCASALVAATLGLVPEVMAQAGDRTIEEIKTETQARAERGAYPLIGIDPRDAREAHDMIKTRDPDEWAAAWSAVGDR